MEYSQKVKLLMKLIFALIWTIVLPVCYANSRRKYTCYSTKYGTLVEKWCFTSYMVAAAIYLTSNAVNVVLYLVPAFSKYIEVSNNKICKVLSWWTQVHEYAILLNLGSLQAISMKDCVLIFEYNRKGGQAFLESLLPRLNPKNSNGGLSMPFELEIWLQLAYSWMRFSEEIKEILGTIVKHKVLLVSNEKINFFLFKFIMRKTCILFAYV
ncbi:hypothetical protein AAHE18_04G242800 [Arachis hypogaea]|nr:Putative callose synthase [Arachis hypogaea]